MAVVDGVVYNSAGTPVAAAWCGYVPQHPCYVVFATQEAATQQATIQAVLVGTVSVQVNNADEIADAIATRMPGAAYAPTITAVADALAAGPQPAGYSRAGRDIDIDAYGIDIIDVEMYNFDCIAVDVMQTSICPSYGYIRRLWVGPVEVPIAMITRAALALAAVAFVVRR
jgi:hypothetical protein